MTDTTWAEKVLEGVPRYKSGWRSTHGEDIRYDDALAALAKLGAGDGLVDRLLDWSEFDDGKINDTREEAADRIAALTAQNRELALDVLASSGQAQEAYAAQLAAEAEAADLRARVARLEGAQRRIRKLPDHIEEQVKVTRDYAADCGMNPSQITLMDICTSHFLDMARELRAALTDGGKDG